MQIIVIGLGSMGKRRIRLLRLLQPEIHILGVDQREDRRNEVEKMFSINCTDDIPMFTQQDKSVCAFVCTEPLSHYAIIKKCLEAGYNVFTEINLVSQGHDELLYLAQKNNKVLFVSSTPLYREEMKQIIGILKEDSKPVQYIYHVGQYLPDWHPWESIEHYFVSNKKTNGCREILGIELPWMTNAFGKIVKVECNKRKLTNVLLPYADTYIMQLHHEGGTSGIFVADLVCRQAVRHLEIYNENLYVSWDGKPDTLKKKDLQIGEMKTIGEEAYLHQTGYEEFINEHAYINELNEFFEVMKGKEPIYSIEREKEIIAIMDDIEEV